MRWENYIYSKTCDFYLILPMKTGSVTASWIFTYFDFFTYTRNLYENNEYSEFANPALSMVHSYYIPTEVENPKIIITARNPYDRVLSRFLFTWTKNELPTVEDFDLHITKSIENNNAMYVMPDHIKPTYVIHLETLFEDYMKIPFVVDSKLNSSGILKEVIYKKINETRFKVDKNKFLTDKNKELIYNFMKNQFDLFGYEK